MDLLAKSRKALVGAGAAVITALAQSIAEQCGHALDWKVVAGGAALALIAVYITPNKKAAAA
jgi:hypothetical protein